MPEKDLEIDAEVRDSIRFPKGFGRMIKNCYCMATRLTMYANSLHFDCSELLAVMRMTNYWNKFCQKEFLNMGIEQRICGWLNVI
jgi:hypothetical protein